MKQSWKLCCFSMMEMKHTDTGSVRYWILGNFIEPKLSVYDQWFFYENIGYSTNGLIHQFKSTWTKILYIHTLLYTLLPVLRLTLLPVLCDSSGLLKLSYDYYIFFSLVINIVHVHVCPRISRLTRAGSKFFPRMHQGRTLSSINQSHLLSRHLGQIRWMHMRICNKNRRE